MNRLLRSPLRMFCLLASVGSVTSSPALAEGDAIRGAGATFPLPIYLKWAADYRRETGVEITYAPLGSGGGVERMTQGKLDFAATDVPLPPAELQRLGLLQFPAVIGGVVPVVNLSGIRSGELRLTGPLLADIYLGKVRQWNDKAIADQNPGLNLPSTQITVVHRLDSSGTTHLWSQYLADASPVWKSRVGVANMPAWPTGVAETGNEGVASSVQRTRAAIGYVEYAYAQAHDLGLASLRNRDGRFVVPSAAGFRAAQQSASWRSDADLDRALIDREGADAWPITSATFVLLSTRPAVPARSLATMKFFEWAMTKGRRSAAALGYVAMPDAALDRIFERWSGQMRSPQGTAVWPTGARRTP